MSDTSAISIDELLTHSAWVRGLSRRLVRDPDLAEDLVQDTWLEVLRSPPRNDQNPRGWLSTVLRRCLSRRTRVDPARRRREVSSRRPDPDQPHELLSRLEAHQRLVAAVHALPEPYRSIVLLRFLEGLKPREIARRRNMLVSTVHSQLQRGLAILRREMDRRCGERRAWAALILGLPRTGPLLLSLIAMQTKHIVVAGGIAAILLAAWVVWPAPEVSVAIAADAVSEKISVQLAPAPTSPAVQRESVSTPSIAKSTVTATPRELFGGRIVDTQGLALPGLPVGVDGAGEQSS